MTYRVHDFAQNTAFQWECVLHLGVQQKCLKIGIMKHIFECPLAYTQLISVHGAAHMEQANHLISLKSLASIPKYKTRLHVDYSHI